MFYSHEILTSQKHGVATIWLVATLGSKSSLKKVSRKAILDVNVPKACETIADPDSPMALRLQSSLLYGVSRVFSQQCGYILTDMQSLHEKMRGATTVMREFQIDSGVVLTNNQLNLPMDPGFNFDMDMALDLSIFNIVSDRIGSASLLSPPGLVSTQSSLLPEEEVVEPQLRLPLTTLPEGPFSNLAFEGAAATSSIYKPIQNLDANLEEPGIDLNPSFDIGDDGVIVDRPHNQADRDNTGSQPPQIESGFGIEAMRSDEQMTFDDIHSSLEVGADNDFVIVGDDDLIQDPQAPSSIHLPLIDNAAIATHHVANQTSVVLSHPASEETETTAEAPQKKVPVKALRVDYVTELSNRQLSDWQQNYLQNMATARIEKFNKQSLLQAKRRAAFWILEQGIGGVLTNFGDDREPHPLSIFSGEGLIDLLRGMPRSLAGRKRSYSHVESETGDEDEDARRYSGSEENVGRGDNQGVLADEEDAVLLHEDDDVELEMGRHPASSLKDRPSSMPWNALGSSRQGSIRGSAQPGFSSSVRGLGLDMGPPSAISGHRPRLASASPLFGRGRSLSRLASLDRQNGSESFNLNIDDFDDPYAGLTGELDDSFELYGPAAVISTQQAAQSQWLAATLENEAHNFLAFLQEQIATDADSDKADVSITFTDLLPPRSNSNVVAAQGLLHVLALATKGLIKVRQEEAFGDITLSTLGDDTNYGEGVESTGEA